MQKPYFMAKNVSCTILYSENKMSYRNSKVVVSISNTLKYTIELV